MKEFTTITDLKSFPRGSMFHVERPERRGVRNHLYIWVLPPAGKLQFKYAICTHSHYVTEAYHGIDFTKLSPIPRSRARRMLFGRSKRAS